MRDLNIKGEINKKQVYCYGTLWTLTFFFFLLSIFLDFIFLFFFFLLTIKGHMTLQSHDRSHDVTS